MLADQVEKFFFHDVKFQFLHIEYALEIQYPFGWMNVHIY